MGTIRIRRRVNAPRALVYRALLDADAIARWRVPAGMTCHVHEFGRFRDAAERLRAGDRLVKFPAGSFPPGLPFVEFASAG